MKKSSDGAAQLKKSIEAASKKSKESIHEIINSSSKKIESAFGINEKFIESLEKQFLNKEFSGSAIISETKKALGNSIELSENAIDTIIDIQSEQLSSNIDFNMKLADALRELDSSDNESVQSLIESIEKRLGELSDASVENTKKMTDIYNKHINLAINFNERFSKNITNQMQMLTRFQKKNSELFNDWAMQWWKDAVKEETVA